jgi:hypothetical protein
VASVSQRKGSILNFLIYIKCGQWCFRKREQPKGFLRSLSPLSLSSPLFSPSLLCFFLFLFLSSFSLLVDSSLTLPSMAAIENLSSVIDAKNLICLNDDASAPFTAGVFTNTRWVSSLLLGFVPSHDKHRTVRAL